MKKIIVLALSVLFMASAAAQTSHEEFKELEQKLQYHFDNLGHRLDMLDKKIDDILWYNKIGDIALVDKVRITGPPLSHEENTTGIGVGNPVKFYAYIFIPRKIDRSKKYPLLIFPHGGVHSNFSTYYTHIVRELTAQGYIIIAPEFRGSTGYGKSMYEKIDYGGLEIEDTFACHSYMFDNYSFVDKNRVGILGWSHGGLITLMNIFNHPEAYKAAFAGVPVSDLIARMGYMTDSYRKLYSADYHIGKTAHENIEEYKRRSPAWNTHKLATPLLIHTNTNDEDVNVLEVEHLIKSLKSESKKFSYKVFKDVPGGHSFDRMDTKKAKEIRLNIYKFLGIYLKPPFPFTTIQDIHNAGYR